MSLSAGTCLGHYEIVAAIGAGVVLYEMLTGNQLFQGSTISDILAAVLKVEPDLNAAPVQVRPLLDRCLQKSRKSGCKRLGIGNCYW